MENKILGITVNNESKIDILEQIIKYISQPIGFYPIVSLNPENLVIAQENKEFEKVIKTAQIKIIDGIGIVLAARILGVHIRERITGVDLMEKLSELAGRIRLRVLLIGGGPNLALRLTACYQKKYPKAKFLGTIGFSDIKNPTEIEERQVFDIVRRYKPHIIFAAFGSPEQELWLFRHSKELRGIICMGVGQGFDVIGGIVKRAPVWLQNIGLEWLYRLLTQPWRWKRQLRLIKFIWLIMKQRVGK